MIEDKKIKTIVIVEDEIFSRQGLKKLISKISSEFVVVGEAENGYEGIKIIQDFEPDIVITDIIMPKINGIEMIKKLQEMGIKSTFVILSGYTEFEYARTAIKLGVSEYLLKPIMVSDLSSLLNRFLDIEERESDIEEVIYSVVVSDMKKSIEENFGLKLSLTYFSQKYKLTPEYLSNLFAKEIGETFSNYLKIVRLEKAKELLLTTNMKIYEIAYTVGYPDQKYFSKVFKEYTGVSAKKFVLNKK